MKKIDLELAVGFFLLVGILCLGYMSIKLGRMEVVGGGYQTLYADFVQAGGIKPGNFAVAASRGTPASTGVPASAGFPAS